MALRQGLPSNPRAGRLAQSRTAQRSGSARPTTVNELYNPPEPSTQVSSRINHDYDEGYDTSYSYAPSSRELSIQNRWKTPTPRNDEHIPSSGVTSEGSAVWDKVVGLTISVSQAWAANINKLSGEDTPPGSDSRLTRAMKAYHLEKATSPADLPNWLFDECERRVRNLNAQDSTQTTRATSIPLLTSDWARDQRSLRDIYDSAASPQVTLRATNQDRVPSKATDRLKALRDAKKGARRNLSEDGGHSIDEDESETRPATSSRS